MMRMFFWLGLALFISLGLACEKQPTATAQAAPPAGGAPIANTPVASAPTPASAPAATPNNPRGPNERYYAIQQKLDEGGSFYLYADVKDLLRKFLTQMQPVFNNPQMGPQGAKVYAMANQVIDRLGLYGITDLGVSVMPDGNMQRSKVFISAPEGRQGLLKLVGGAPHPFALLKQLPQDTMLLMNLDFDAPAAYALVKQIANDLGGLEAQARIDQTLAQIQAQTGLNVPAIIASLSGEFSLVAAQDPMQKLNIPGGAAPVSINSPELALIICVKDATLYESLKTLIGQRLPVNEETTGTLRKLSITVPANPVWPVSPALATDGHYVYLATQDAYLKQLTTPPPAGATLADNAAFKKLSAGLPAEGNGLVYYSPELVQLLRQVMTLALQNAPAGPQADLLRQLAGAQAVAPTGGIAIRVNQPDGLMIVSRDQFNPLQLMPAFMVAPAGLMAAIAVPNFLEAQSRSKVAHAKADMRSMATAIEAYYVDNNSYPAASTDPAMNAFGSLAASGPLAGQSTFMMGGPGSHLMTLTTPIAYLTALPMDPFSPVPSAPYCYYPANTGWILWSPGPDGTYDLTTGNIMNLYNPAEPVPSPALVELTYDPSNGTKSGGDVWRVKQ